MLAQNRIKRHERKEFNQQVKNYRKAKASYKNN
jgi:uncharacterized membrane protein